MVMVDLRIADVIFDVPIVGVPVIVVMEFIGHDVLSGMQAGACAAGAAVA
ncbi:hypothetical protein [Shinella sp. DD12]|nr:hypothetical protein [Shinella sp. DD12]EYR77583.1 hypothetical protein SHLA_47c000330 [Shinella sp. DD12]